MSRHGRSGGNCSSCTPTPRQFSFRAAAVTRQNVLVNSRPSGGSRRLPTPGQVQHGQRRVAAASSQLLRRSSNAQIMSSVTRYWPELASLSSFARILKAYHPFQIESYPPI